MLIMIVGCYYASVGKLQKPATDFEKIYSKSETKQTKSNLYYLVRPRNGLSDYMSHQSVISQAL